MRKAFLFILVCFSALISFSQEDSTLKEYTGKYKFPSGSMVPEVDITLSDNILTITAAIGSAELEKVSRDTFMIPSYGNALVFFGRNAENKIATIRIDTGTDVLEGKKDGASAWLRNYLWRNNFALQKSKDKSSF